TQQLNALFAPLDLFWVGIRTPIKRTESASVGAGTGTGQLASPAFTSRRITIADMILRWIPPLNSRLLWRHSSWHGGTDFRQQLAPGGKGSTIPSPGGSGS